MRKSRPRAREWIAAQLFRLEHPDAVKFPCPNCGEGIPNFTARLGYGQDWNGIPQAPFKCPSCCALVCLSRAYRWSVVAGFTALALFIPSALRISPVYFWFGAVAVLWVLLGFLSSVYVKVLFPPKIRKYDGPPIPRILEDPKDLPFNPWRKR